MPIRKTVRCAEDAVAEAERVAALRREATRARLDEAQRLMDAARRDAAEPGSAVRRAREGAAA
jgi:hypothetical protein